MVPANGPSDRARDVAARAWDLPSLPEVAAKILERVRDPETTAQDLEEVISKDPAVAAKVLSMANSPLFGLRQQVSSLQRAIVVLGFNTLRSLVMAAATHALWRSERSRLTDRLMWEHSLGAAVAARLIAHEVGHVAVEECFVAGLVHDLGKLVMLRSLGDDYGRVLERVYLGGSTFLEAEREILGFDHTEVGSLVVRAWELPGEIEEAVRLHHRPRDARIEPRLCAIVGLANDLCVRLEIGPERRPDLDVAGSESAGVLSPPPERLEPLGELTRERVAEAKDLFGAR